MIILNIFILDYDMELSAQYHPDKHIVKMPLEATQILCTALYLSGYYGDWIYKPTHKHHPCVTWVMQSRDNWVWLRDYVLVLGAEYTYRYGRVLKAEEMASSLPYPMIKPVGMTPFVKCMPDDVKTDDAVESYRAYFRKYKNHIRKYSGREIPYWWY